MGMLRTGYFHKSPDFDAEMVDCVIGFSPHPRHTTQTAVRTLGRYANEISRREWFDDILQTMVEYELPIFCDRDFFLQLPNEATFRETFSEDVQTLAHATTIKGGVGSTHRWRVKQTIRSARDSMEYYGLEWPLLVAHHKEISMITRLAIAEGIHPIVPQDLPLIPGEEDVAHYDHHRIRRHLPGFLKLH